MYGHLDTCAAPPPRPGAPRPLDLWLTSIAAQMKILLTNDDGIQASGIHALRRALLAVPGVELAVIAPDANRSASARSITTRQPLWVEEVEFGDGTTGFATDGTPGGLRALRDSGPDRVPAGADRLRHQPRREPRRRHHLLRHRRGGARGGGAGRAGNRRLPAVHEARDGLPLRPRLRLHRGRGLRRAPGRRPARPPPAGRHPSERELPGGFRRRTWRAPP